MSAIALIVNPVSDRVFFISPACAVIGPSRHGRHDVRRAREVPSGRTQRRGEASRVNSTRVAASPEGWPRVVGGTTVGTWRLVVGWVVGRLRFRDLDYPESAVSPAAIRSP